MEETSHFVEMIRNRGIRRDWVERVLDSPRFRESRDDNTEHYLGQIAEYGNRWLRVVVNVSANPNRLVTAFFDRRVRERS